MRNVFIRVQGIFLLRKFPENDIGEHLFGEMGIDLFIIKCCPTFKKKNQFSGAGFGVAVKMLLGTYIGHI